MRKTKKIIFGILICAAMLILIFDSRTAINSVSTGIDLCLRTVAPALFPFLILSGLMNRCFLGQHLRFIAPIGRFCRIPTGAESVLLIGFLSGYPVGAKLVAETYFAGHLTKNTAKRMLGFCSNAGPSFIFGMIAAAFTNPFVPWVLWGIHIISALVVGFLLPDTMDDICKLPESKPVPISQMLYNAIKNLAMICGWVILFRIALAYLDRLILNCLSTELQVLIYGVTELSNGCIMLNKIGNDGVRFIMASVMLAFGGCCVAMQTISVTDKLGSGAYFPGKLMQMLLSIIISYIMQPLLFQGASRLRIPFVYLLMLIIFTLISAYLLCGKKVVAFHGRVLYNIHKKCI